jgi:hypothetical protein
MNRTPLSATRRRRILAVALALGLAALLVPIWAGAASAHEDKAIGRYRLSVGFADEPVYAGQKNSVQVLVTDAAGRPVTDLGDSLKVMVMMGKQTMDMSLEPFFEAGGAGTPGDYRAFFIPSTTGKYTLHVYGSIRGQKVSQPFTFAEIRDPAQAAFPKLNQPTTGQMAQRLDRESARLGASVRSAIAASGAADQRSRDAADQIKVLTVMGALGFILGLMSAILGGSARRIARRSARRTAPVQADELRTTVEV